MSNKVTVVARNLKKDYFLHRDGSEYGFTRKNKQIEVSALKGVSFVANKGESIGVVGHNGSGKSTLFKLIAGGLSPTSGEVFVSSEPTLLGVSSALQPNLSGRINVRLGLLSMGLKKQQVSELEDEVASWADIGDAINRPLKTYSSGMRARLVFAVSTAVRREILLIDEALSTGDSSFARRAQDRMEEFLDDAGTVFLVSHGAGAIQRYCSRALWLHEGEIIADDSATAITKAYLRWSKEKSNQNLDQAAGLIEKVKNDYIKPTIIFDREAVAMLDGKPS